MTRIIAVAITKGGTGKTTTVCNLGHGLALLKKKVLLVDCDTQGHLAAYWGLKPKPGYTIAEVLDPQVDRKPSRCLIEVRPGLNMMGSDRRSLAKAKLAMAQDQMGMGAFWLRDRLAELSTYDYILLDTAPSWDILSMAALLASQEVLMPISTEFLTIASATDYVQVVADVQKHNPQLKISWILPTFLDARTKRSLDILQALRQHFLELVVDPIRINSDLSSAASYHKSIFEHAPASRGAEDYLALVERIANA